MEKQKEQNRHSRSSRYKTPTRYRLELVNENTLSLLWSLRINRKRLIFLIALIVFAVICIGAMLISFTPLRTLLPGYLRPTERREYIEANERIDSLLNVVAVNDRYLNNLNNILSGKVDVDSLINAPVELSQSDTTALRGASEAEQRFIEMYSAAHEGFTLEESAVVAEAPAFVSPVRDVDVQPGRDRNMPKIKNGDSPVNIYAIARSTVIESYDSPDEGGVITLQHPGGYISRYSGMSQRYFDRGQTVQSGAKIGQAPIKGQDVGFELLRDGIHLNPFDYIKF